jgi:integrase
MGTKTAAGDRLAELAAMRATGELVPRRQAKVLDRLGLPADADPQKFDGVVQERRGATVSRLTEKVAGLPSSEQTLSALIDAWAENAEHRDRATDYVIKSRQSLRLHALQGLGDRPLSTITGAELDRLYAQMRRAGAAPATILRQHRLLGSAFRLAVKWEWLNMSPTERATGPTVHREEFDIPTPAEVLAIIEAARNLRHLGERKRLVVGLTLGAQTGARRGELCGLRWSDVKIDEDETGIVTIARSLTDRGRIKDTKAHRVRSLSLDVLSIATLRAHVEAHGGADSAYVLSNSSVPAPTQALTRGTREAVASAGYGTRFRFHSLRHYSAATLLAAGVDVRTVMERLGWSSVSLVDRYRHVLPTQDHAAAAIAANALVAR